MKLVALIIMAGTLVSAQSADPVRVDKGMQVSETPSALVLTSPTLVEPLTGDTEVTLAPERVLELTPGIRFTRTEEGYTLATHDGKKIELKSRNRRIALASPVLLRMTDRGWEFGEGEPFDGTVLSAQRHLTEDAEVVAEVQQGRRPTGAAGKPKLRVRWLYTENPMATAEIFNTQAIQQLVHLSPLGF